MRRLKERHPQTHRSDGARLSRWAGFALIGLVALFLATLEVSRPHVPGDVLSYDSFLEMVEEGRIKNARILDEDAYVMGEYVVNDGASIHEYNVPLLRGTQASLLSVLVEKEVPVTIDQQVRKRVVTLAAYLLPALILMVLFVYLIVSYRSGSGLFSVRSGARRVAPEESRVSFDDVAGQEAAVTELREVKEFLADPERFRAMGAVVPKGILLYGPPGCGKTMLARALASEAGASFYSISGSDFVELYVGVGASRVRDLFQQARQNAPALIFIDELDSVGRARGNLGTVPSHGEQEQALNQILAEMDGFSPSQGIIVLAATNRPDILDPALLRPGRFDRSVGLERPGEQARLAILAVHSRGKILEEDVDLASIANRAIGMTGADLASVMNEGALLAARAGRSAVAQSDLELALQRTLEAPERQRRLSLRERSIAKRFASDERITFAEVAGADDAIRELAEVKEYLAEPDRFLRLGARVPRGILLAGPPGCGKTLLARALAGEANAAFFSVAGSEFVEVFVGEGASRVRELFAEARSVEPAIIFIDEIDAIGSRRESTVGGHREAHQTLNQILVEMDGFESRRGVIVMAATNRPDVLDPALTRPGRFDRMVTVGFPDRAGRRAILEVHAAGKPLGGDVDLDRAAALTQGLSGADLANVMNEAALLAARGGLERISMGLVEEGIDRATMGVASRGTVMADAERRVVAYHEAGHALVALALPGAAIPNKVSIVPKGQALGQCTMLDAHDRLVMSRSLLVERMAVLLGGWVAERIVFGESGSAGASDLQRVGDVARHMVCELGMGKGVGLLPQTRPLSANGRGDENSMPPSYSADTARAIELEILRTMEEAHELAHSVLHEARSALDLVADGLMDSETLSAEQIRAQAQGAGLVWSGSPSTISRRGS